MFCRRQFRNLKKNTSKDLSIKGTTEKTTVNVQLEFIIDEEGLVIKQKLFTRLGTKMWTMML